MRAATTSPEQVGVKIAQVNRSKVAKELGLDRSYVSQVLGGKRVQGLGLDVAAGIAKQVGVSLDEFHGWWAERVRVVELVN
jgi:transcriptional regulator with XRE-family HTH domain